MSDRFVRNMASLVLGAFAVITALFLDNPTLAIVFVLMGISSQLVEISEHLRAIAIPPGANPAEPIESPDQPEPIEGGGDGKH